KNATTNRTHHRSNHPGCTPNQELKQGPSTRCARSGFRLRAQTPAKHLKMRAMSGCRLVGRQLSLILREAVYDESGERPSELVTVQRDGRPMATAGEDGTHISQKREMWATG